MIYLDYAANTPVDEDVLEYFCQLNRDYIANPNSSHALGRMAKEKMNEVTNQIGQLIGVSMSQIIYTSGASEANNLAIKGIVGSYRENGKHIISTGLEHSSVAGTLTYLQKHGYEIDLLDILSDGTVDLDHLRELMRKDTVLVSIAAVDSELGVVQPIKEIRSIVSEFENCFFHTDATQIVGKLPFSFDYADLVTFAPHKFFGMNGCGVLIKKEHVVLEPLIHGGASTTLYRSGTPVLPMAGSIYKALEKSFHHMNEQIEYVSKLNQDLCNFFKKYPLVRINSTNRSLPHILNVSVKGVKSAEFQRRLEEQEVYVSTKSACSVPNTPSRAVYAVSKDRKNALSSWRISLSERTTLEEVEQFKQIFDVCYHQ